MTQKVRNVRLYGVLGSKFGRVHRLAVANAAEAIRALSAQLPGFQTFLANAKDKGLAFSVFQGRKNVSPEELSFPCGSDDIRIAPMIIGSKRGGVFQTILGIALVAVSFFVPPAGAFGMAMLSSTAIGSLGVSLALGGVAQMLTPVPKGLGTGDNPENTASKRFNGPVNTQAQGNAVPLLYGRLIVGSATISAAIHAEDVYAPRGSSNWSSDSQGGSGGGGSSLDQFMWRAIEANGGSEGIY